MSPVHDEVHPIPRISPRLARRLVWSTLAAAAAAGCPAAARALDAEWAFDAVSAAEVERSRPYVSADGTLVDFEDTTSVLLRIGGQGEVFLGESVSLGGRLDSGDLTFQAQAPRFSIGGRSAEEEARETAFLREAWAAVEWGEDVTVRLEAGRTRLTLGAGLLLDTEVTGGRVDVDWAPWTLGLGAAIPSPALVPEGPPVLFLTLERSFDAGGRAALLYARDTGAADDVQGEVSRQVDLKALERAADRARAGQSAAPSCLEPPPTTRVESVMHWLGLELEHTFPGGQLAFAWLTGFGEFDVEVRLANQRCIQLLERRGRATSRTATTEVLGHAAAAQARLKATESMYPGLFVVWLSGNAGRPGTGGDYEGFLAIAPFPERPALFFDVGATSSVRTDRAATPGINGRGVLGAGPTLLFAPTEDVSAELVLAWLLADEPNPATSSRDYGPEADLRFDWDVGRRVSVFARGAATPLGAFFPERHLVWQASMGVQADVEGPPAR